jgi:prevent-host-death family protein
MLCSSQEEPVNSWPVQYAKARFSECLRAAMKDGPQVVTLRGEDAAVLVSAEEWRRLNANQRQSARDLLLADEARFDLNAERGGPERK